MKIVFIAASHFGLLCLKKVLRLECCQVVGVVTAPKTFPISYRPEGLTNVLHADIHSYCKLNNINCSVIKNGMADKILFGEVAAWKPDIFLVVGWYHMIPKRWRNIAPAYGLHASLLPDYSGGAPLVWAIINGEKKTGITFFQLDDGVDNGAIVDQAETPILKEDTIATLYSRIEQLGLNLILQNLPNLVKGQATLSLQDESKRRIFPQRRPEDGIIDWRQSGHNIYNFIRAQTKPYPGAFTLYQGNQLTIWDCEPLTDIQEVEASKIGQVLPDSSQFIVKCGTGGIVIKRLSDKRTGEINGREYRKAYVMGG